VEIVHNNIDRCLGYLHAKADPNRSIVQTQIVLTEDDWWRMEKWGVLQFGSNSLCIQWLACCTILAYDDVLVSLSSQVYHWKKVTIKQLQIPHWLQTAAVKVSTILPWESASGFEKGRILLAADCCISSLKPVADRKGILQNPAPLLGRHNLVRCISHQKSTEP